MVTCLDVSNAIESLRPSSTEFLFATRQKWIDEICKRTYHDIGKVKYSDYLLTTAMKAVSLSTVSTQLRIDNVIHIYVTATKTTISSNATSTTLWNEYEIENIKDPVNTNSILFSRYFSDERLMRVQYLPIPALFPGTSTDSTSVPDIDDEATNVLIYGTLARICKAGDAPDVQLANQYESDYREELKRCKVVMRKRTNKLSNDKISYQEWNW